MFSHKHSNTYKLKLPSWQTWLNDADVQLILQPVKMMLATGHFGKSKLSSPPRLMRILHYFGRSRKKAMGKTKTCSWVPAYLIRDGASDTRDSLHRNDFSTVAFILVIREFDVQIGQPHSVQLLYVVLMVRRSFLSIILGAIERAARGKMDRNLTHTSNVVGYDPHISPLTKCNILGILWVERSSQQSRGREEYMMHTVNGTKNDPSLSRLLSRFRRDKSWRKVAVGPADGDDMNATC